MFELAIFYRVDNPIILLRILLVLDLFAVKHPIIGRNDLLQKKFADGDTVCEGYVADF